MKTAVAIVFLLGLVVATFAQSNSYVDLKPFDAQSQGSLSVPAFIGIDDSSTIQISFNSRTSLSGQVLLSLTANGGEQVVIKMYSNKIQLEVPQPTGSGTAVLSSSNFNFAANNWYTVVVTFRGSSVDFGVISKGVATSLGSASGFRVNNIARQGSVGANLNGFVDNLFIWSVSYSVAQINAIPLSNNLPAQYAGNLVAGWTLDEGFGTTAFATSNDQSLALRLVGSAFSTGDSTMMRCWVNGDPHYYTAGWDRANLAAEPEGNHQWSQGPRMSGTYHLAKCAGIFEMRSQARLVNTWDPNAVTRQLSIRAYDRFYLASLSEGSFAEGFYTRDANTTSWTRVAQGSYVDINNVAYSYYGSTWVVSVPNVGYATGNTNGAYMNYELRFNKGSCGIQNRGDVGLCDFVKPASTNIQFLEWKYGADPTEPKPPPTSHPCDSATADLKAAATTLCTNLYPTGAATNVPMDGGSFDSCMFDVCVSGDPDFLVSAPPAPECLYNDYVNEANGVAGPSSCLTCPNQCSSRGKCVVDGVSGDHVCQCSDGWTGSDCGLPVNFACQNLVLSDNIERIITSYRIPTTKTTADFMKTFAVAESLVFTPVVRRDSPVWSASDKYALAFTLNSAVGSTAGSVSFSVTFTGGNPTSVAGVQPTTIASNVYTYTNLNFGPNRLVSASFEGLTVASGYTIKVISSTGLTQVLVAVGTDREELDVFKVPSAEWTSFSMTSAQCTTDPCNIPDEFGKCSACANLPQCGYCVESGRCMSGTNAGPKFGTCKNWRFSFDDNVARRVTYQQGWPVTPVEAEVILTSSTTGMNQVPIDYRVAPGTVQNVWDIMLMLDATADSEVSTLIASIGQSLLPTLQDNPLYPNVAFGVGRYGNSVSVLQDLSGVSSNNLWIFQRALESFRGNAAEAGNKQLSALKAIATNSGVALGWRQNARKMAIIQASQALDASGADAVKAILVDRGVMPVFVVNNPAAKASYDAVVGDLQGLGFGLVLSAQSDCSDIHAVIQRALRLATGQVVMVIQQSQLGQVNTDALPSSEQLNIFGLTSSHRGRFIFPMKRNTARGDTTTITAIGFGKSKIEEVDSDKPVSKDFTVTGAESTTFPAVITGNSFHNLVPTRAVIQSLPAIGALFQANPDGSVGAQITSVPAIVANPAGKVLYTPPRFQHSYPVSPGGPLKPFTTFTFSVDDGCAPSGTYTATVIVTPVANAPNCDAVDLVVAEDSDWTSVTIKYDKDPDLNEDGSLEDMHGAYMTVMVAHGSIRNSAGQVTSSGNNVNVTCGAMSSGTSCSLSYKPVADYNGPDSFQVACIDSTGMRSFAKVSITVTPVNDVPEAEFADVVMLKENATVSFAGTFSDDADTLYPPNSMLTVTVTSALPPSTQGTLYATADCTGTPVATGVAIFTGLQAPKIHQFCFASAPIYYSCDFGQAPPDCKNPSSDYTFTVTDGGGLSSTKTVKIYSTNVIDPPTADNKVAFTAEDTPVQVTVTGTNNERIGQPLNWRMTVFSDLIEIRNSDGQIVDVNSPNFVNPTLTLTPKANVFGNKDLDWSLVTIQYIAWMPADQLNGTDPSLAQSANTPILVKVYPVNDAPVATLSGVTTAEKVPLIFTLTATDIDNPEAELNYTLLTLPDAQFGTLFLVNEDDTVGAAATTSALIVRTKGVARLLFQPFDKYYGTGAVFNYRVKDIDHYFPQNGSLSDDQTVVVTITPVNDAPLAAAPTLRCFEDTATVFTLTGTDPWYGENDPLDAYVEKAPYVASTSGCQSKAGTLYQFDASLPLTREGYASQTPIADGAKVADAQYRVVYVPAANMNNDPSTPAFQFVQPALDFYVQESSSNSAPRNLRSATTVSKIQIEAVNDAPYTVDAVVNPDGFTGCTKDCSFPQNMGVKKFQSEIPETPLFFGGQDIEKTNLTPLIVGIETGPSAVNWKLRTLPAQGDSVEITAANVATITPDSPLEVPVTISPDMPSDCLTDLVTVAFKAGVAFTPGRNEQSDADAFYLRIYYVVRDSDATQPLTSDINNPYVITIKIFKVDQPPYAAELVRSIHTFEDTPKDFVLRATDVESEDFTVTLFNCKTFTESAGQVFLLTPEGEVSSALDCATAATVLSNGQVDTLGNRYWNMRYVPGTDVTTRALEMSFKMDDSQGHDASDITTYTLSFSVYPYNAPPTLLIAGQANASVELFFTPAVATGFAISIEDVDFLDPLTGSTEWLFSAQLSWNSTNVTLSCQNTTVVNGQEIVAAYSKLVSFLAACQYTNVEAEVVEVTVVVSDRGHSGYCETDNEDLYTLCARNVTHKAVVTTQTGLNVSAVAAGAAAAAGLAAAAAIAGALYKKLGSKNDEAYAPWEIEEDNSLVDNPLYLGSGLDGSNPLFQPAE